MRAEDAKPGGSRQLRKILSLSATYPPARKRARKSDTMKIIFVGIHNKPGLPPLCSSTKTGKIIDRIIDKLPPDCMVFEKRNLFPVDYLPYEIKERQKFVDQFPFEEGAYYITLGKVVSDSFDGLGVDFFPVHHPGYICRFAESIQSRYIQTITDQIRSVARGAPA